VEITVTGIAIMEVTALPIIAALLAVTMLAIAVEVTLSTVPVTRVLAIAPPAIAAMLAVTARLVVPAVLAVAAVGEAPFLAFAIAMLPIVIMIAVSMIWTPAVRTVESAAASPTIGMA
jgi:hypothetical protein